LKQLFVLSDIFYLWTYNRLSDFLNLFTIISINI